MRRARDWTGRLGTRGCKVGAGHRLLSQGVGTWPGAASRWGTRVTMFLWAKPSPMVGNSQEPSDRPVRAIPGLGGSRHAESVSFRSVRAGWRRGRLHSRTPSELAHVYPEGLVSNEEPPGPAVQPGPASQDT